MSPVRDVRKRSNKKENTIGIVFPMLPDHIQRIFQDQKNVFVKFLAKEAIPRRLRAGSKLFFYQSGGSKEIVGEARIIETALGTLQEVSAKFGERLFLTQSELEEYAGNRGAKTMLVLLLDDAKKYEVPLKLGKSVTMAGQYLTREMYDSLKSTQ
jgi:hypothetical protein